MAIESGDIVFFLLSAERSVNGQGAAIEIFDEFAIAIESVIVLRNSILVIDEDSICANISIVIEA